jgi:hypothetical protein
MPMVITNWDAINEVRCTAVKENEKEESATDRKGENQMAPFFG